MTTPSRKSRMPLAKEPSARVLPGLVRSEGEIAPDLKRLLQDLANGRADWPLYLHGGLGTGKTHAALCLCDRAETAVYFTVASLCNRLMALEAWEIEGFWEEVGSASLGVLDELASRDNVSDFHYDAVKQFLDEREAWGGNRTILISNQPLDVCNAIYDGRISSRAGTGTVFCLQGRSKRRDWRGQ